MAVDLNLETISSGFNTSKINRNFQAIDQALQNAVSRSGESPNQMNTDFDMNSNDILNVGTINADTVTVDGVPLVPGDVSVDPDSLVPVGGTDGQVLTKQSAIDYDVAWEDVPEGIPAGGTDGQVLTKQSGTDFDANWETPTPGGIWDAYFTDNVAGIGRFGTGEVGGFMSYETVTTPAAGYGVAVRDQALFNYTGGSPGTVNSTHTTITTVNAGVADFVWGQLSILTNNATAGENTAFYGQGTKKSGAGPTWGGLFEAIDDSGVGNQTSGLVAFEIDIGANGTDNNNQRLGMHIVGRRHNTGGSAVEFAEAIRIDSSSSSSSFKKGISFFTGSPVGIGIDISGATISGSAIKLADNQKIIFDTSDSRFIKFDGTRLVYGTATNANAVRISDAGFIGVNVAPAVAFDASGTGDTQLRLVDGSSVDFRLTASSGSAVGFIGTISNHDVIFRANSSNILRIATSSIVTITGSFSRGSPVTKTANFTVAATENWLINNKSGSTCTVTLPSAASFPGRELHFKNSQAQTVVSASSNVVPRVTAAAGTAILASGNGNWCTMVSDGTNWVIMQGS